MAYKTFVMFKNEFHLFSVNALHYLCYHLKLDFSLIDALCLYYVWVFFFQKNLKIWKSVLRFVSEVVKISDLIRLAIFPNDNS